MDKPSKLKTNSWGYILFTLLIVVVLINTWVFFGKEAFYYVLCVMPFLAALAHFFSFLRTKNWGHIIPMLFYIFIVLTFFPPLTHNSTTRFVFGVFAGFLFVGEIFVLSSKKTPMSPLISVEMLRSLSPKRTIRNTRKNSPSTNSVLPLGIYL